MKVEYGLNPNCSEAVFRFYTLEPRRMQEILQALADEIDANTGFDPHKGQKIPLFERAEQYATKFVRVTDEDYAGAHRAAAEARSKRDRGMITDRELEEMIGKAYDDLHKKKYPAGTLLRCCAGMGDNECVVTLEKRRGAFVLNIGNNDISENKTGWVEKVTGLGIQVEEAERSQELCRQYARDCTCGITFFPEDYAGLVTDEKPARAGRKKPSTAIRAGGPGEPVGPEGPEETGKGGAGKK
jgi:hypothetical protein